MSSFLWLAAVTGALSLLTPCVFPMIPITVTYFGGNANRSRAAVLGDALLFASGIVVTFTALGLGLALLVGASGLARLAANPWVNIAIGLSFVAFALNLMGLWELRLRFIDRTVNSADTAARNRPASAAASLLMGFAFTLASFTCTAPFVGPLLVSAARGDWHRPLMGMLVFSLVFSAPFFILAVLPEFMRHLPKPGHWMISLRFLVGLAELGASLKFFSNADLVWRTAAISRNAIVASWAALALVGAIYLALPILTSRGGKRLSIPRALATTACLAVAFLVGQGVRGTSLGDLEAFLPPPDISEQTSTGMASTTGHSDARLGWILNDQPAALAKARQTGKLVLIDFTGYTCSNCRWMESNIFNRPDVAAALSRYVLSRLYTDGQGALYEKQQDFQERQFGTVALPLYAIVDADGRTVRTFAGLTRSPAEFLAFLGAVS
jgi:thiol:disulfide interchange protein DsbD